MGAAKHIWDGHMAAEVKYNQALAPQQQYSY